MKLAQLNIALAKYALDAPEIKDFVDNLDQVNGIAERSEGFYGVLKTNLVMRPILRLLMIRI
ncbi:uncharacterized protein DUF3291 [Vibrio crassostreae]|nr:uncharacterized protein DUF3291 [Vibrio crassostreae]TCN77105.1 uncharacterized protein DUF3291 [Vibrio crassostreae]TWD32513.1 uncharacterized protein DUF3291 [Vibrio crassostreae]TWD67608.1 uncharacterized protein DUF3291 [Vibrio crassostreae]